jgi:hypothetical protein
VQAVDPVNDGSVERASGKAEADETNLDGCFRHLSVSPKRTYILIPRDENGGNSRRVKKCDGLSSRTGGRFAVV